MCVDAADGIQIQCGREYGFANEGEESRATELYKMSLAELKDLPTNNLDCERDLAEFSHLASVAKFRNKSFKAKGIRTDMTLYQAQQTNICTLTRKIQSMLFHREADWTKGQRELQTERIMIKMGKAKKEQEFTKRLLESCKSWGGPCTTPNQIEITLNANPDKMEKIIYKQNCLIIDTHIRQTWLLHQSSLN